MAKDETKADMGMNALRMGGTILSNLFFTNEIDFLTKLLIVIAWTSLVFMFIYLALPMSLRRKVEELDFDPKVGGRTSLSGLASVGSAIMLGINKFQKNTYLKTAEEKLQESFVEKEFRLRQQFMTDIHTYQFVLLLGVWLTINFILKVNRDREYYQAIIEGRDEKPDKDEKPGLRHIPSEEMKPKSNQEKKDD